MTTTNANADRLSGDRRMNDVTIGQRVHHMQTPTRIGTVIDVTWATAVVQYDFGTARHQQAELRDASVGGEGK
jgi:hypothetical protein